MVILNWGAIGFFFFFPFLKIFSSIRIETIHRLKMIELMIQDSNWLMIDTNETYKRERELNLFGVIEEFYHRLKTQVSFLKKIEFYVFWLQGIDGANAISLSQEYPFLKSICVSKFI